MRIFFIHPSLFAFLKLRPLIPFNLSIFDVHPVPRCLATPTTPTDTSLAVGFQHSTCESVVLPQGYLSFLFNSSASAPSGTGIERCSIPSFQFKKRKTTSFHHSRRAARYSSPTSVGYVMKYYHRQISYCRCHSQNQIVIAVVTEAKS
jgi:hypothetical protein